MDQLEILDLLHNALAMHPNVSKVSMDNDNNDGEIFFTYKNREYVLRSYDIQEVK